MRAEPHLCWSPVQTGLSEAAKGRSLVLVIAPFIQYAPMEFILKHLSWADHPVVLTRWRAGDVTSGVSDIDVYPLLKQSKVQLMVNDALHMKMFVFDDGIGFITSANITGTGLGLHESPNIEVGMPVSLGSQDASQLALLLSASRIVTGDIFKRVQGYVEEHSTPTNTLPPLDLGGVVPTGHEGLQLPLVAGPENLWQIYSGLKLENGSGGGDVLRQGLCDIQVLKVPGGLNKQEFELHVREMLYSNPVVKDIIDGLEQEGSFCFGQVISRMQRRAPGNLAIGRRDLKPYARALYDWLPWLRRGVSWDRPRHSMVLRLHARTERQKGETT
jgi:hypothetical protein